MTFNQQVWNLCRKIPKGNITTYKEMAHALNTTAYRAVGNALNKNPHGSNLVPCHRVINSNGNLGGFAHGIPTKSKLLKKEGIQIVNNKINLKKYLFKFS